MHTGTYRIAGVVIQVETIYPATHIQCQEYKCEDTPAAFRVQITEEDIAAEQVKSDREAELEGIPPMAYPPEYLESLAVYRKIAREMLLNHSVLLFHGSAIAVDDQAVLFTAISGTGKSTHTRLWRELLGQRCYMVNDDKPLLRIGQEGVQVCGTPWNGKHHLGCACMVPLKAICILERGETNEIIQLKPGEALPTLLQQSYRTEDARSAIALLQLLDRMTQHVAFYRLRCNMDPEAAKLSYETILGA